MSTLAPCVDGSELARTFFTFAALARCARVFGLCVRQRAAPLAVHSANGYLEYFCFGRHDLQKHSRAHTDSAKPICGREQ
jgi:hypothetical protein